MRAVLVLFVVIANVLLPRSAGADEGWVMRRFDSAIQIARDGRLRITETIDVDFGRLEKHGIFREIPIRYEWNETRERVYRLDVELVDDGVSRRWPYETEHEGANFRIRIGDPDRTVSGAQTYRIVYSVEGVINPFEDRDELFWNVHGHEWDVPTSVLTATVSYAGGPGLFEPECFQGPRGSTQRCAASLAADHATFTATRALGSGEDITIGVSLPKGAVAPAPEPILGDKPRGIERWFDPSPLTVALAVMLGGSALWAVYQFWSRMGRDKSDGRTMTVVPEYEPPQRLHPAQLGLLLDERADTKDLTATIIDLAVRGYLRIVELPKEGLFGKTDWRLEKLREGDGLDTYEAGLLAALFADGDQTTLSDAKGKVGPKLGEIQQHLYDDAVARRWFLVDPARARLLWGLGGLLTTVAGVGMVVLLGVTAGFGLVGVGVAAAGILLLVLSPSMGQRTAAGRELFRQTLGFQRYIETAEKHRAAFAERENIFSEYLPYAIVFGAVGKWAAAFAGMDATKTGIGSWYVGSHFASTALFAGQLQSFSSNVTSTIGYTPGSSGGSYSGGGGFSGGGGGGGGGGSW